MDKRSWPWKKKSSGKQSAEKAAAAAEVLSNSSTAPSDFAATQNDLAKQDSMKKPKYVQISMESYTHLTGLEDQVKSYQEQVKTLEAEIEELHEKLSEANSEMTNKENLVKQHEKVAEDAISGWEKAEAEAATLKSNLESVTLLKLTAEDKASHLDGALKECMRQIRNLKEEHEFTLNEVVLSKAKQFDKMKLELEAKIADLDRELVVAAAESSALSRSLQERSNMLVNLSEKKSQAEAEIELLKGNVESCQKEINSLQYELHIAQKEVEIRSEEKNISVRSAEVANKQHLEGVKKIAKLEAECQRLRGLVRKKLPGPAALAQMKVEVENLGKDYGESRVRKSPVKSSSPRWSQVPEIALNHVDRYQKENELLTERLLAMEEETKMLKEALAKRNSELQTARSTCAKTDSKLRNLEAQLQANGEERCFPTSNAHVTIDGSCAEDSGSPPSMTSMSEDGNEDTISCTGSRTTGVKSERSVFIRKEKNIDSSDKSENAYQLDLMNDFLEMEKLAILSNDSHEEVSNSEVSGSLRNTKSEIVDNDNAVEVSTSTGSKEEMKKRNPKLRMDQTIFVKLQRRLALVLELISKEKDTGKLLEDIRPVIQEVHDILYQSLNQAVGSTHCSTTRSDSQRFGEDDEAQIEKQMSLLGDSRPDLGYLDEVCHELEVAISQIYDFVMILDKEAKAIEGTSPDGDGLNQKLGMFSAKYVGAKSSRTDVNNFVIDLSSVLSKASEFHFNILGYKCSEVENGNFDCIDKIVLPENKGVVISSVNAGSHFSDSTSDPDIPHDGNLVPTSESTVTSWKCSLEEFEQSKLEKNNMAMDLPRCMENLENTKSQLLEMEQLLAEVKSQLTSSQKSNSLAETQLKCMTESYKTLETRADELQTEVNLLHGKIESLENELQEEKNSRREALNRCEDLQEQLQRIQGCAAGENDAQSNQEKDLAAAAEKLAECQETIFLLGKQLKSLRPQSESGNSPYTWRSQKDEGSTCEKPTMTVTDTLDTSPAELSDAANLQQAGTDSLNRWTYAASCQSDSELSQASLKHPKHQYSRSGSSSSSSTPTPVKPSRGFSKFFSTK